jgi:dephospho-CoA kinase
MVHPVVKMDFTQWAATQNTPYVLKEAALLFETGSYRELDKTILVSAPLEIRIDRVMERDPQRGKDQIYEIIARQLPEDEKRELADFVIDNKGNKLVIPQVLKIHEALLCA